MLTEQQCDALIGKNETLDDVVVTRRTADPTAASCREWVRCVAGMGVDVEGDIVDILEAVLEHTEQSWYVEHYMPGVREISQRSADAERKFCAYFMETGKWGRSHAAACGVDVAAAADFHSNTEVSPKVALRTYALDVMIDHPEWGTDRVAVAISEFGPVPAQNTMHIWRHDRKDPRSGERRESMLSRRMRERGLLAEDAEGGVLSHTRPSAGVSA